MHTSEQQLFLTLFRIIAVGGISWWLFDSIKKKLSNYLTFAITLILAGAIGNIIDSVFYGVVFNDSYSQVATIFSDKPYGTWFHGEVVDMLYFPIISGTFPAWVPVWGGQDFEFFRFIFNIADSAISVGMAIFLITEMFFKKDISETVSE